MSNSSSTYVSTSRPARWPHHVQYILSPRYHTSVSTETRRYIQGSASTTGQGLHLCSNRSLIVIRLISNTSHPAYGQYGLFAAKNIPPNTRILDYIGEIHCDDRPTSDYDLSLYRSQDGINVGLDASETGNEARFINDYRGVKAKHNVVFADARLPSGELRMGVWSSASQIKKGEEILVSYGKAWWRARSTVDR